MSMRKTALLVILLSILLSSCTVTEVMTVDKGTSGAISSNIEVQQYFVDVLTDFAQFLPENNESIMDSAINSFAYQLSSSMNASSVRFIKTGENSYYGTFSFNDFSALAKELAGGEGQSIIQQTSSSLSFYVDINNYQELERKVPFLADPNIEVFLANYNIGYSEEDYLDMIVFSLGEEAPESLKNSLITIQGAVPGEITNISGAVKTSKSTFEYSFPLIDFLLLSKPLSFQVEWK